MPELDLRKSPWDEGLSIHSEYLLHQLYYLFSIFHASQEFDIYESEYGAFKELRKEFQEREIGRVLLVIAAAVRNDIDRNPIRAEYWSSGLENMVVGSIRYENKNSKEEDLIFRESCNKIIHCDTINFHYLNENPRRGDAVKPKVHIYGTYRKTEWKATIVIDKFINVAYSLI